MRIVVAGGTGFLGSPLVASLAADGHDVVVLTRAISSAKRASANDRRVTRVSWTPNGEAGAWASAVDGVDAVINLAGESIAKRWTRGQKQRILDSRVDATRSIAVAIQRAGSPPSLLVNGSAVGYYGPRGDDVITEQTPAGGDFLAQVCARWESEARNAARDRTRVVCVRTGIVLHTDGGALRSMLPPFRFGAGGPVGSGRQYWPWIHRDDWVSLVRWIARSGDLDGAINATAPHPVTNAVFARTLGRVLHRPAFMPAPAFALRVLLGEMADGVLLSGQRAVPERALRGGFTFAHPDLEPALRSIFNTS